MEIKKCMMKVGEFFRNTLSRFWEQLAPVNRSELLVINGVVWDEKRISLLRNAVDSVSQACFHKANAYLAELCMSFGYDTYLLNDVLEESMPLLGYGCQEVLSITNWVRAFRTGVAEYVAISQ